MRALWLTCVLLLAGCAGSPKPFFDAGIGYQLDEESDWFVRTERDWQCEVNIPAQFNLGLEWENKTELYIQHNSWYFCGGPFWDDRKELYNNGIYLKKRWGGQ